MVCTHCGQHNQCTRCLAREARAVRQKSKGAIYSANSRERKRRRVDEMQRNAATQERALLALQDRLHDMRGGHAPVRILAA